MAQYDRELTDAEKVFWANMMAATEKPSTQTKIRAVVRDEILPHLTAIEDNTNWLSKFIANLFKFGGGQAEQKYPRKK